MLITLGKKPLLARSVWSDKALKLPYLHLTLSTIQLIMFNMYTDTPLPRSHCVSVSLSTSLSPMHTHVHSENSGPFTGPLPHTLMVDKFERREPLVRGTMVMNYQEKNGVSAGLEEVKLSVGCSSTCEDLSS